MLIASLAFRVVVIAAALPSAPDGVNAKFGDAVAVDAALSWISSPGRFTCPAAYSNDSYRYVADMMATCGIRHVRERLRWADVAPSPETFKPGRYLRNADMLVDRGIGISSVFADAPPYARPSPKLPRDLLAVHDFCRALAECFGSRMEMWEFWNEEDIQYVVEPAWEYVAGSDVGVVFTHTSPDGDEGFPGKVEVKVTYTLTKDNVWRVDYEAVPDKDTPINMTQHVYFNFKGEAGGTIEDHVMKIAAKAFTPTDKGQIPTGKVVPVKGTPFDFTKGMRIGEMINAANKDLEIGRGYDHNWVLDKGEMAKGRKPRGLVYAGEVSYPPNGRKVEVWTAEPCLQVYTANWCDYNQTAKGGEHLSFRCGIALETQHAPDSPNKPKWPTTIVKAGQLYRTTTEFRFGVA